MRPNNVASRAERIRGGITMFLTAACLIAASYVPNPALQAGLTVSGILYFVTSLAIVLDKVDFS